MKSVVKKLALSSPAPFLRNLALSLVLVSVVALTLYILINSPA